MERYHTQKAFAGCIVLLMGIYQVHAIYTHTFSLFANIERFFITLRVLEASSPKIAAKDRQWI
jgi:hypothetical protein